MAVSGPSGPVPEIAGPREEDLVAVLLLEQTRRETLPEFAPFVGQLFTEWSDRFGYHGEEREV